MTFVIKNSLFKPRLICYSVYSTSIQEHDEHVNTTFDFMIPKWGHVRKTYHFKVNISKYYTEALCIRNYTQHGKA